MFVNCVSSLIVPVAAIEASVIVVRKFVHAKDKRKRRQA
jgi:hypothetical protein